MAFCIAKWQAFVFYFIHLLFSCIDGACSMLGDYILSLDMPVGSFYMSLIFVGAK
jgi:hypothetical protein